MAEKEYIERDKLIGDGWHLQRIVYGNGYACIESKDIRDIPAADVRPVVLCRDCTFFKPQQKSARWSNTTPMCSRSATIKMPPDGFCSFGIKREES